tara:strand:+ start:228 stop:773 length:546 start_codon:yes stop_codon:yes gene_type:complete
MDTGTWGLYYNYTWWGNAIQTAPSVIGKPDFFGSQFLMLTSQQPNQVTNGDFATDSDWTKGTGWSIANGKATVTNSTVSSIYQDILDTSKIYKTTFEITDITSGSLRIGIGINFSDYFTETGTYTYYGSPTTDGLLRINPSSGTNASIDNVSVQIVRADEVEAKKCVADWIHRTALQDLKN